MDFKGDILAQFPDLDVSQLRVDVARSRRALVESVDPAVLSPLSTLPVKIHNLLQAALRRNLELAESFTLSFNRRLYAPLFSLSRASLETGCVAYDSWLAVEDALRAQDMNALVVVEERLMLALLGTRAREGRGDPDVLPAPNILTIVDRLNRREFPKLRWYYDNVSDYVHPNYPGMLDPYAQPDADTLIVEYRDQPFDLMPARLQFAVTGLSVGVGLGRTAWDRCQQHWGHLVDFCAQAAKDTAEKPEPT